MIPVPLGWALPSKSFTDPVPILAEVALQLDQRIQLPKEERSQQEALRGLIGSFAFRPELLALGERGDPGAVTGALTSSQLISLPGTQCGTHRGGEAALTCLLAAGLGCLRRGWL